MYVIIMKPLHTLNIAKTAKTFNNIITDLKKVDEAQNDLVVQYIYLLYSTSSLCWKMADLSSSDFVVLGS
jgi:hypothetical protein